jgi:ferrous iron transport protein B
MVAATSNSSAPRRVEHLEARLKVEEKDLERRLAQLLNQAVELPEHLRDQLTRRLDRFLLDPLLGLPLFFLVMFLMFQAIYALGGPLQLLLGQLLDSFSHAVLMPLLAGAPAFLRGFLLEGLYQGIGTVAAFLPVIFLFFLAMAVVEDSGYLSRAAFLMDGLMERLGLDGRSFVLSLMGFGCNVPAILGTRVMRSKGLRILTMLVIPFSLCSARLNVFLFMSAALFAPSQGATVVFSLYLISFFAAVFFNASSNSCSSVSSIRCGMLTFSFNNFFYSISQNLLYSSRITAVFLSASRLRACNSASHCFCCRYISIVYLSTD